ncbi:hypothetical protein ACL02O_03410 [Micromonospora sp. MS34]|uniref:hypothetical protein n=1 Tax=Micromonospora sp. MS34 TaxID=3385971 RepID=UPI0039A1253C
MSEEFSAGGLSWAPPACNLPTAGQPLRVAEFDELFAAATRQIERRDSSRLAVELVCDTQVAVRAASLAVRETGCCSFFTFALPAAGGRLTLEVSVDDGHTGVLDALAERAAAGAAR